MLSSCHSSRQKGKNRERYSHRDQMDVTFIVPKLFPLNHCVRRAIDSYTIIGLSSSGVERIFEHVNAFTVVEKLPDTKATEGHDGKHDADSCVQNVHGKVSNKRFKQAPTAAARTHANVESNSPVKDRNYQCGFHGQVFKATHTREHAHAYALHAHLHCLDPSAVCSPRATKARSQAFNLFRSNAKQGLGPRRPYHHLCEQWTNESSHPKFHPLPRLLKA